MMLAPGLGLHHGRSAACDPFYELAAQRRMPIIYHTGGAGWDWPGDCAAPAACARIAQRFEGLPILMAHCGTFGSDDPEAFEKAAGLCADHPNLHLDATTALLPVGAERWKRALDRIGPERVVYGTDYPWCSAESVERELALIDSLGLGAFEQADILGGTFLRLQPRH